MRNIFLNTAKNWLGKSEKDNSHREIIDIYNSEKPLPRGYKVKYTDSWCAVFVSACAIRSKMKEIIPIECSCGQMISLAKEMGIFQERDNYIPQKGDIILYDWDDSGKGDNKGWPEHVGIVESVENGEILVIEGNINDSVGYRTIPLDGRYIRGFICPDFKEGEKQECRPDFKETAEKEYYPAFSGNTVSIVDALKQLRIDYSFKHRKEIAIKNGISSYTGKASENLYLLDLLKKGKLIKE